jgi:hypothetical protein
VTIYYNLEQHACYAGMTVRIWLATTPISAY